MERTACSTCAQPLAPGAREKLEGLCLACLGRFILEEEPAVDGLPLRVGSRFQGLEVVRFLARGGMGVVYQARQPDLDRVVALKILSPTLADDAEFAKRFNGEAKVLALLSHPGIVQVFDFGRADSLYYLVMEYVEGMSLRQLLRERRLTSDEVLRILSQICAALEYAHLQGVVHRDIKPENILIDGRGQVKLADFGLAKILRPDQHREPGTETRVVLGTPQYMAPEQTENRPDVDHRADIYALGVILYETLTGAPPGRIVEAPSRRAGVDHRLDVVVRRALEPAPERRYQRVSELKTDIDAIAGEGSRPRPLRARTIAAAAACVVAAVLGGIYGWSSVRPRPVAVASWQLENPGAGTRIDGDEVVLTPGTHQRLSEAVPKDGLLAKSFRLRFRYRYEIEPKQEPWLFLVLEASPGSGHERNALIFFSEGDHTLAFASRVTGKGWGLREKQTLPEGAHGPGKWIDVEVEWDDQTRRLRVSYGGKPAFNAQLGANDSLHGRWHFGLGGAAKEVRIRDVAVWNVP